jgi:hypothetical protein
MPNPVDYQQLAQAVGTGAGVRSVGLALVESGCPPTPGKLRGAAIRRCGPEPASRAAKRLASGPDMQPRPR